MLNVLSVCLILDFGRLHRRRSWAFTGLYEYDWIGEHKGEKCGDVRSVKVKDAEWTHCHVFRQWCQNVQLTGHQGGVYRVLSTAFLRLAHRQVEPLLELRVDLFGSLVGVAGDEDHRYKHYRKNEKTNDANEVRWAKVGKEKAKWGDADYGRIEDDHKNGRPQQVRQSTDDRTEDH